MSVYIGLKNRLGKLSEQPALTILSLAEFKPSAGRIFFFFSSILLPFGDSLLKMVDEKDHCLIGIIRRQERNCLGHITKGDSLLRTNIEGRMEGKEKR